MTRQRGVGSRPMRWLALAGVTVLAACGARTAPQTSFDYRIEEYLETRRLAIAHSGAVQTSSARNLEAQQDALRAQLQQLRSGLHQGVLFDRDTSRAIRKRIADRLAQSDGSAIRAVMADPPPPNIQPEVNTQYPPSEVRATTPPSLLEILPRLPPEMAYRFVGRNLLLLDRNTSLILDILPDAIPSDR